MAKDKLRYNGLRRSSKKVRYRESDVLIRRLKENTMTLEKIGDLSAIEIVLRELGTNILYRVFGRRADMRFKVLRPKPL